MMKQHDQAEEKAGSKVLKNSELSVQFAEVEGEKEKLYMNMKNWTQWKS